MRVSCCTSFLFSRVISRAPGLKLVVETLITSLKPIGNIVLICCAFFIIFGILGVQVKGNIVPINNMYTKILLNTKTSCLFLRIRIPPSEACHNCNSISSLLPPCFFFFFLSPHNKYTWRELWPAHYFNHKLLFMLHERPLWRRVSVFIRWYPRRYQKLILVVFSLAAF